MMAYGKCPRWIADGGTTNRLSKSATRVLFQLLVLTDGRSFSGRVGLDRLSERSDMTRRMTLIGIKELTDSGVLKYTHATGEYELLDDDSAQTDCAAAQNDCADAQTDCANRAKGLREPRKQIAPLLTIDQDSITKNIYQGDVRASVPFAGTTKNAYMLAGELLPSVKWNPHRRSGETGTRLLSKAILRIRDGARGPDAAQDPGGWIGDRMAEYLESLSDKRYHPDFDKWITKQYPDLVSEGEPLDAHR